jgi:hypothetical protein
LNVTNLKASKTYTWEKSERVAAAEDSKYNKFVCEASKR